MARRKRTQRKMSTVTKRRRKMSKSMGSVQLKDVATKIFGAIGSRAAVNAIGKFLPQVVKTPTNKALTQIALGFLTKPLASLVGSKSAMIDSLASGMMIGGAYELAKVTIPAAFGQAEDDDVIVVSGMDDISEINGMDDIGQDISEINGMDEIGEYYDND